MPSTRTHWSPAALLALVLVAVVACSELGLEQRNPGSILARDVYKPENAQLLVSGAIGDFECAFHRYVVAQALLGDELVNAFSNTSNFDYDRRTMAPGHPYGTGTCTSSQIPGLYTPLSVARGSADTILARLTEWTDAELPATFNRQQLIGKAAAYAGYSILLLGESMCSAAINLGPELTPAQIFAEAKTRFDSAIVFAAAASDATTQNFAALGRARTQLDLGNAAAAATDAALVPAGFVVNMSTDGINVRRENFVFLSINLNSFATVDPTFRGVTINAAPDPRVAVTNTGKNGTAPGSQIWTADKYPALTTVMPIARYAEAQLIIAEAKAGAGDVAGAAAAINVARATHAGLPPYDATGQTAAQVKTQIIEERRRELFLEGHRLGDIRRYALPLSPPAGAPYPGGGLYGSQSCFPLPDVERLNNPNIRKS
jgi:hypothetical protein